MITYRGLIDPLELVVRSIGRPPDRSDPVAITIDQNGAHCDDPAVLEYMQQLIAAEAVDGQLSIHAEGDWHPATLANPLVAEHATCMILSGDRRESIGRSWLESHTAAIELELLA